MDITPAKDRDQIIRLPLSAVLAGCLIIILLGLVGGIIGAQLGQPQLAPLTVAAPETQPLPAPEVKNTNSSLASTLANAQRSILLLKRNGRDFFGTGLVLTNDGLIVTAAAVGEKDQVAGYDSEGREMALDWVGADALFDLSYFRASRNILVPLDLGASEAPVGSALLALSRNTVSFETIAAGFTVNEYALPESMEALGTQRVMRGILAGRPAVSAVLIDSDGKASGILLDGERGRVLPASQIKASFDRVRADKADQNIFADLGLETKFNYANLAGQKSIRFVATVAAVRPESIAAAAGLKRGDIITQIGDSSLTPTLNLAELLATKLPLNISIERDGSPQTITLAPLPL